MTTTSMWPTRQASRRIRILTGLRPTGIARRELPENFYRATALMPEDAEGGAWTAHKKVRAPSSLRPVLTGHPRYLPAHAAHHLLHLAELLHHLLHLGEFVHERIHLGHLHSAAIRNPYAAFGVQEIWTA